MNTRLTRRRHFQCLHRYAAASWSDQGDAETSGACFLPAGHGHDYWAEVTLEGRIEPESGMIINLIDVDEALARVLAPLEGRRLDQDVAHFRERVPTTENIAAYVLTELKSEFATLENARLLKVRLFESDELWVDAWL